MTPAISAERIGLYTGLDLRRSKRMHRAVRLMILDQDSEGQPFRQKMSTVNVSVHGCCYQSWHGSQVGAKVELQLTEGLIDRSALVHAKVRYVRPPAGNNELYQIGVEFDSPQAEWLGAHEDPIAGAASHLATVSATERTATKSENVPSLGITQERAVVERVAATIDRLMAALQAPVQRAAETAAEVVRAQLEDTLKRSIQREVRAQLDQAVRQALGMMDEISSANSRRVESSLLRQFEQMIRSSEEGVFGRVETRLRELHSQWEERQQQQPPLCTEPVNSLESAAAETRFGVITTEMLDQFRRQLDLHADLALTDMKQRVSSSLAELEAENHAACAARGRLFDDDLAQAAQKATEQFRSEIKAHLYAKLVTAIEAVDKHASTALAILLRGSA